MPRGDIVLFAEKHRGKELKDLSEGSVVGTSSLRRIANLKSRYPHLKYENIRGNLNTRLVKLEQGNSTHPPFKRPLIQPFKQLEGQYDAIILAEAGVVRLGWKDKIGQYLNEEDYLYAPG